MIRRLSILLLALALLAIGCSSEDSQGRLRHRQFDLEVMGIDWLTIIYHPKPGSSRFPYPVRVELYGNGAIVVKTGPSPQVLDDFSSDYQNPAWNQIAEDRKTLSQPDMQLVLQTFINEGVIPATGCRPPLKGTPYIHCAGTLGFEKFINITSNAILVDTAEDFIETNFRYLIDRTASFRP